MKTFEILAFFISVILFAFTMNMRSNMSKSYEFRQTNINHNSIYAKHTVENICNYSN